MLYTCLKNLNTLIQKDICVPMFTAAYLQQPTYGNNLSVHR